MLRRRWFVFRVLSLLDGWRSRAKPAPRSIRKRVFISKIRQKIAHTASRPHRLPIAAILVVTTNLIWTLPVPRCWDTKAQVAGLGNVHNS